MARIRTTKPEFWTDAVMVSLPFQVRLFYMGLWNFSDDYGSFPNEPHTLKMQIFPDDEFDAEAALDLLVALGRIIQCLDSEGRAFFQVAHWERHQRVDKPGKALFVESSRKLAIPLGERRKVAIKYGCAPGERCTAACFYCGEPGEIHWWKLKNGKPSGWVSFSSLELDHFEPEFARGGASEKNLVLACRACNRSKGHESPEKFLEKRGVFVEPSANPLGGLDTEKEKEIGKGKGNRNRPPADFLIDFEEFRAIYPKRAGSDRIKIARDKFQRLASNGVGASRLLEGARRYRTFCDESGNTGSSFVMQMATWLNQECYDLPYEPATPRGNGSTRKKLNPAGIVSPEQAKRLLAGETVYEDE